MIKDIQFLWVAIFTVLVSACTNPPSIEGKLTDYKVSDAGSRVYLIQPQALEEVASPFRGIILDSAEVTAKGDFTFHWYPTTSGETLVELVLQPKGEKFPRRLENDSPMDSNYMPLLTSDKPIQIESTSKAFQADFKIKSPSVQNKALLSLRDTRMQSFRTNLMGKEWNIHEGTGLLEKEAAHLNYQKKLMEFADTTHSFVSAMVALRWVSPQLDYERTPEFLYLQCERWKEVSHAWQGSLCEMSDKQHLPIMVGDLFPEVNFPLLGGEIKNLKELRGSELTLIDIWASWCVPCRKENREVLVPLWENYHEMGFQIIGYGLETNENAWQAAIEKDGAFRWINASHLEGDETILMHQLRIRTIPANYLIDSEGKILAKNLHGDDLKRFVGNYFDEFR